MLAKNYIFAKEDEKSKELFSEQKKKKFTEEKGAEKNDNDDFTNDDINDETALKYNVFGLVNKKIDCFLNSVVQSLFNSDKFVEFFLTEKFNKNNENLVTSSPDKLIMIIQNLLLKIRKNLKASLWKILTKINTKFLKLLRILKH